MPRWQFLLRWRGGVGGRPARLHLPACQVIARGKPGGRVERVREQNTTRTGDPLHQQSGSGLLSRQPQRASRPHSQQPCRLRLHPSGPNSRCGRARARVSTPGVCLIDARRCSALRAAWRTPHRPTSHLRLLAGSCGARLGFVQGQEPRQAPRPPPSSAPAESPHRTSSPHKPWNTGLGGVGESHGALHARSWGRSHAGGELHAACTAARTAPFPAAPAGWRAGCANQVHARLHIRVFCATGGQVSGRSIQHMYGGVVHALAHHVPLCRCRCAAQGAGEVWVAELLPGRADLELGRPLSPLPVSVGWEGEWSFARARSLRRHRQPLTQPPIHSPTLSGLKDTCAPVQPAPRRLESSTLRCRP